MPDNSPKENKMGVMPVRKLVFSMSLPLIIANLVQAMYNIVDSIFVSRICEDALTAVSMAFPIQILIIALGSGTGVGVNALLSRSLGEKNKKMASDAARNGILMSYVCCLIFVVIGLTCSRAFYASQTSDPEIIEYGVQYMSWICCLSFGIYSQFIFERLLQATGMTFYTMITQITGALINVVLDPILIFGLIGFPKLGVSGAAIATVFGQTVAAVIAMILNVKKNKEIDISPRGFRPNLRVIGRIYQVGLPSIIMQAIGSVMNYMMNLILMSFTSTAVAVFGVYYKLQSFVFMPVIGINMGMVPVVAYNYGARNRLRLIKASKISYLYALIIMCFGTLAFEVIPGLLCSLFGASEEMLAIGIPALRIIGIHFPVAAFCIIGGSVFQALGNGVYSLIVSVMRQLVVLIPAAYLLSLTGNLNLVWLAFPIAEVMSFLVTFILLRITNKKVIRPIPDGAPV